VPLLPSSIIWYWRKLERKQTHHAMPCVRGFAV